VVITCTVSGSEVTAGDFRNRGDSLAASAFQTQDLTFTASSADPYSVTQQCQFVSFDDSTPEGDEDFTVTITVKSGLAVIGAATAQGTILQNDFQVGFRSATVSITEGEGIDDDGDQFGGGNAQVCVDVTAPASGESFPGGVSFSLEVSSTDGSAGSADYTAVSNQPVAFNNNRRTNCFVVEVLDDLLNEGDETFTLTLTPPSGTTLNGVTIDPSRATVTIPANDPLAFTVTGPEQVEEGASATFTLAIAPTTLTSPDGMQTAMVTHALSADVEVTWTLSGTGITADDFTGITDLAMGNTHTISASTPVYTFDVDVADEGGSGADDVPETFTLTVTEASSAGMAGPASAGASANVEIVGAGSTGARFAVTGSGSISEGASNVDTTYTVTLSGLGDGNTLGGSGATTVTWTITHGETVDADFSATTGTVMFPATSDDGDTQTFQITVVDDTLNEGQETFSVQVASGNMDHAAGTPQSVTITDEAADATTVTITKQSPSGNTVDEAGDGDATMADVTFRVALSGGVRTGAITVPVSFSGLADGEYDILAPSMGDYDDDSITADTAPPATATGLTLTFGFERHADRRRPLRHHGEPHRRHRE